MTRNPHRWFSRLFALHHHAVTWLIIVVVTLALLSPPWAAAQTQTEFPPPPKRLPLDSKLRVSPSMAIIFACLVSAFFVMGCVSVFARYCVDRHLSTTFTLESDGVAAAAAGRRARWRISRGLDPAVIDSFPTFVYSEVKGLKIGSGALECAVCLNEFEDDETLRLLPTCSHVFHPDCIDAWLSSHVTCPVCRSKPGEGTETRSVNSLSHDQDLDSADPIINRGVDDDSIVHVQSPDLIRAVGSSTNQNFPPRSTSRKERVYGKLWRSKSVAQPGENCERFTLRLPEEVRNRLVNSTSLSRTKSCVAFQRARSERKGYRSGSGGNGRWGFMATPPFFSRAGSAKVVGGGVGAGGEEATVASKNLLKSVTSPLHRLIWGSDGNKGGGDVGERSIDRLRLDGDV